MLAIGLDQRARDGVPQGASLAGLPAAVHERAHIERAERVGRGERLLDVLHQRGPREVVAQRAAVHVPLAGAGREVDARNARLAAANGLPAELIERARSCGHLLVRRQR